MRIAFSIYVFLVQLSYIASIRPMGQDDVRTGQDEFPIGHLAPVWWGKMTNFAILVFNFNKI